LRFAVLQFRELHRQCEIAVGGFLDGTDPACRDNHAALPPGFLVDRGRDPVAHARVSRSQRRLRGRGRSVSKHDSGFGFIAQPVRELGAVVASGYPYTALFTRVLATLEACGGAT